MPSESVNLVITSPPYAERRIDTYGGVKPDQYINWFSDIAIEIKRVLTIDGSFFLNLKEHTEDGFRNLYVYKLIINLVDEIGFGLVDTFCWTKNGFPGKPKNKFKNGWEPIYHFAKQPDIKFRPDEVMIPMQEDTKSRLNRKHVGLAESGSGFAQPKFENLSGKDKSYPSNHIHLHNVVNQFSYNKWHPATYPKKLVEFFIKAYSDVGDLVLDPFIGSGVTALIARDLGRNYLGFELSEEYCQKLKETTDLEVII